MSSKVVAWALFALVASAAAQTGTGVATEDPFTFGPEETTTNSLITSTASVAIPTGPVIGITLPGTNTESQVFVGSIVATDSLQTTVILGCAPGASPSSCALETDATVTAGPSTLKFTYAYPNGAYTEVQDCSWSSTGGGICTVAGIGPINTGGSITSYISAASTTSYAASEVHVVSVPVTAGATNGLDGVTDLNTASASSASKGVVSTSTSASQGRASTAAPNNAEALLPVSFGAGLMALIVAVL